MSDLALAIEGLSFAYGNEKALDNIGFQIRLGECTLLLGPNGAGKSTLLKLITGTTCPTQGEVQLHGRVAAILELGMGFNPN